VRYDDVVRRHAEAVQHPQELVQHLFDAASVPGQQVYLKAEHLAHLGDDVIETLAGALRGRARSAILLGGRTVREQGLLTAARIAGATGAKLLRNWRRWCVRNWVRLICSACFQTPTTLNPILS